MAFLIDGKCVIILVLSPFPLLAISSTTALHLCLMSLARAAWAVCLYFLVGNGNVPLLKSAFLVFLSRVTACLVNSQLVLNLSYKSCMPRYYLVSPSVVRVLTIPSRERSSALLYAILLSECGSKYAMSAVHPARPPGQALILQCSPCPAQFVFHSQFYNILKESIWFSLAMCIGK